MSRGLFYFFRFFGWRCWHCLIRFVGVRHPAYRLSRSDSAGRSVLLYHYTIVIVKVKGSTVVFLKVFWNRRKLLVSKGLRRRRPAPLALSRYRARGYVNPASSLRPHHHEAQAHALALREERKGKRFGCSHQFRTVQHIPTTQDWAACWMGSRLPCACEERHTLVVCSSY